MHSTVSEKRRRYLTYIVCFERYFVLFYYLMYIVYFKMSSESLKLRQVYIFPNNIFSHLKLRWSRFNLPLKNHCCNRKKNVILISIGRTLTLLHFSPVSFWNILYHSDVFSYLVVN